MLLLLLIVLVWPVGLLTGGDDKTSTSSDAQPAAQTNTTAQPANNGQPAGIAIVVERKGKKQLLVQATNLDPSGQDNGYYVWLYNSPSDSKSMGGQVTDQNGNYQAIGPLPADFKNYKFIDITRQPIGKTANVKHTGNSVLRGPMPKLKKSNAQSDKATAIGNTVLTPPG